MTDNTQGDALGFMFKLRSENLPPEVIKQCLEASKEIYGIDDQTIDLISATSETWEQDEALKAVIDKEGQISPLKDNNIKRLKEVYESSEGLVKSLAKTILLSAQRQYDHFAIASSLATISAAAQGSYLAPSILGGPASNLSLYQIITAPAASGKDHYLTSVKSILSEVDERLVADSFGSIYGMTSTFYGFNSRLSIIDEIQDEFAKLGRNKGDYLSQIFTSYKKLFNNLSSIDPVHTRDRSSPKILQPKFSFIGAGTGSGLQSNTDAEFLSGGLQSRIAIYPMLDLPDKKTVKTLAIRSLDVSALKKIMTNGINADGFHTKINEQMAKIHTAGKIGSQPCPDHVPALIAQDIMEIDDDAKMLLLEFMKLQELRYKKLVLKDKSGSEISAASVIDRSVQMALKFSAIHGLGKTWDVRDFKRPRIDLNDAKWGINLASTLADIAAQAIDLNTGDREEVLKIKRVLSKFKKGCTMSELIKGTRYPSWKITTEVFDLLLSGEIHLISKDGELYKFNSSSDQRMWKMPYGYKVCLHNADD